MILAFAVYKNQWTVDFASVVLAGLERAVTLSAWVGERVWKMAFANAILLKAGEVMFVKFLDVLASVKTAPAMVTVIAPYTSARATLGGQE